MWDALIMQRHRELNAVAKMVGGVEEIRYQAGRGTAPFKPVPADQQRAAVKFLIKRAFTTPQAMLDPEIMQRITPTGATDGLQDSNQKLLQRLLDAGVFQRMAEAQALTSEGQGIHRPGHALRSERRSVQRAERTAAEHRAVPSRAAARLRRTDPGNASRVHPASSAPRCGLQPGTSWRRSTRR